MLKLKANSISGKYLFLLVELPLLQCTDLILGGHSTTTWTKGYPILIPLCIDFLIDGQISSFEPDQYEAKLLNLIMLHKVQTHSIFVSDQAWTFY